VDVETSMGPWGGSKKLKLFPMDLTYSTSVMLCRALGQMTGDGFVEYIGLCAAPIPVVHIPLTTEQLVCCRGTWSFHRLPEHGYLLPERQVLKDIRDIPLTDSTSSEGLLWPVKRSSR